MPKVQKVGPCDLAIAASTSGTFLESQGPGAVAAVEIAQADVADLPADLAAKADDAAVVKLVGDQTIAGSKSFDDPILHDMDNNPSHIIDSVIPVPGSQDVTFNRAMATGDGNPVMSFGWNTVGAGQRQDLTKPTFRIGMEYDYAIGGEKWMEGHLFACIDPATGNETRPLSVVVNKTLGYKVDTLMQGSSWTWQNKGQTVQIAQLTRATDESVYYKITGKDSSDSLGYAFSLISDAVTPQDTVTVGRKAGLNNNLTVQGSTSASLSLIRQGTSTRFVNDGNFSFICAAGQLFFNRTDDFIVCSRDTARLGLRIQDNGAAVSVGLFGVTPVTRRSGDLTTGVVDLGLFSSVTSVTAATIQGGTTAAADLQLSSTSHATKGKIKFGANAYYDEATGVARFFGGVSSQASAVANATERFGLNAAPLVTTAIANTVVGSGACPNLSSGTHNTIFGFGAATGLTTGTGNCVIGSQSNVPAALATSVLVGRSQVITGTTNLIAIGNSVTIAHNECIAIGTLATTTKDNQFVTGRPISAWTMQAVSSTQDRPVCEIQRAWVDSTDATRKGRMTMSAYDAAGLREALRLESDGTQAKISLFGGAAAARQSAIPDTSGATLLALEAEVNKLKQLLRNFNLMAP